MNGKNIWGVIWTLIITFIIFFCGLAIMATATGCSTAQPALTGSEDFIRLEKEYQRLRAEHEQLQSDYKRLTDDNRFYAEYYQQAADSIRGGLEELTREGNSMGDELDKLREYNHILTDIIQRLIDIERSTTRGNSQTENING